MVQLVSRTLEDRKVPGITYDLRGPIYDTVGKDKNQVSYITAPAVDTSPIKLSGLAFAVDY